MLTIFLILVSVFITISALAAALVWLETKIRQIQGDE